jgi:predicted small metal-binding protein
MVRKIVKCDCGFLVRSDDDNTLVAELQQHAKEHHQMNLSREQVLAMAQPDPGGAAPSSRGT